MGWVPTVGTDLVTLDAHLDELLFLRLIRTGPLRA